MGTDVAIVVPMRDASGLIDECLRSLVPQAQARGAHVVVVDDGSTDDSAAKASAHDVRLLRSSRPGGPYAARNRGWRSTDADLVVFTDAFCRARAGWLEALVRTLEGAPEVAIAGGDTITVARPGIAESFAHRRQGRLAAATMDHPWLPYLPTCNLATRRSVLESLGGFLEVRSGGDLDLCWRAHVEGLGRVAYVPEATMDAEPPAGVLRLIRQYRKYGEAAPVRAVPFLEAGYEPLPPADVSSLRLAAAHAKHALQGIAAARGRQMPVHIVESICWYAYRRAYRRSYLRLRDSGVPLPPPRQP